MGGEFLKRDRGRVRVVHSERLYGSTGEGFVSVVSGEVLHIASGFSLQEEPSGQDPW